MNMYERGPVDKHSTCDLLKYCYSFNRADSKNNPDKEY